MHNGVERRLQVAFRRLRPRFSKISLAIIDAAAIKAFAIRQEHRCLRRHFHAGFVRQPLICIAQHLARITKIVRVLVDAGLRLGRIGMHDEKCNLVRGVLFMEAFDLRRVTIRHRTFVAHENKNQRLGVLVCLKRIHLCAADSRSAKHNHCQDKRHIPS